MKYIILVIILIPLTYITIRFGLEMMAVHQYVRYKAGIRIADTPSWQEITYMKLQGFEINILYKLGLIK